MQQRFNFLINRPGQVLSATTYVSPFIVHWFADVDECLQEGQLCENGHCTNIEGSFECQCEMGYIPAEDKQSCEGEKLWHPVKGFAF